MPTKNLEFPSENICQNLTSKKFLIFKERKWPLKVPPIENKKINLLIPKFDSNFSFAKKKEPSSPKRKFPKKFWVRVPNSITFERVESHTTNDPFVAPLVARLLENLSQEIASLLTWLSHILARIQNSQETLQILNIIVVKREECNRDMTSYIWFDHAWFEIFFCPLVQKLHHKKSTNFEII